MSLSTSTATQTSPVSEGCVTTTHKRLRRTATRLDRTSWKYAAIKGARPYVLQGLSRSSRKPAKYSSLSLYRFPTIFKFLIPAVFYANEGGWAVKTQLS